jgi:hypothetical protein
VTGARYIRVRPPRRGPDVQVGRVARSRKGSPRRAARSPGTDERMPPKHSVRVGSRFRTSPVLPISSKRRALVFTS